ncbi:hypothetical protein [Nocardioides aurantiacus]|uniref:Uncharacterized protein n=1 Tax=Nocardioides aurantiacus TaxID=86796 RepID=A0A3N2CTL7_9ACTN|nr:hypothetical protein [Nocardioides aurantiacus]ROR90554.1 hypothetical protein EDD33_1395 [Nocardioides aurantiacus]
MSNFSGRGGRKLLTLMLSVGALLASMLTMGASPAAAYGTCSVQLPSKLTVDAPFKRFVGRLAPDCYESGTDYAAWDVEHDYYGPDDIFIFDSGETSSDWAFYDWGNLGSYTIRPSGAWDYDYNDVSQNTVTTSVRLGSRLSMTSSRSGRYVTLRATATRYKPSASGFRAWGGRPVSVYTRTSSTAPWKYLRTRTTDKYGKIATRIDQRYVRDYQARLGNTAAVWGKTASTRR